MFLRVIAQFSSGGILGFQEITFVVPPFLSLIYLLFNLQVVINIYVQDAVL